MDKSVFQTLFIILDIVAFGSSVILLITLMIPMMFVIITHPLPDLDSAFFGPFNWYHDRTIKWYKSVTVGFRIVQVLHATAAGSSLIASIVAIPGFQNKKCRTPAGIIILGSSILIGSFSFSYSFQYIWSLSKGTFISEETIIKSFAIHSENFMLPKLLISVWSMTVVFGILGVLVLFHKFDDEKKDY